MLYISSLSLCPLHQPEPRLVQNKGVPVSPQVNVAARLTQRLSLTGQSFPSRATRRQRSPRNPPARTRSGRNGRDHEDPRGEATRPTATLAPKGVRAARGAAGRNAPGKKVRSLPWSWMAGPAPGPSHPLPPSLSRPRSPGSPPPRARKLPRARPLTLRCLLRCRPKKTPTGTPAQPCWPSRTQQRCSNNTTSNNNNSNRRILA